MHTPNNESVGSSEQQNSSRDQVIASFRKVVERGIANPDDLDLTDPGVIEANRVLDTWDAEQRRIATEAGTLEADLEYALDRSTILLDAGFSDPDYLYEVANDWLKGDLTRASIGGLPELAAKIQAKIDEINARLDN
jgi:hypothetical protein